MDDVTLGRMLRAIRHRRGWRQLDLAARAGCPQSTISLIERGHLDHLQLGLVRSVAAALDARFDPRLSWRGGDLDRILDERHAALVEEAARRYQAAGWETAIEVTYARFGERGSIDLLAVRRDVAAASVNEIKTQITAIEELARRHDQKTRLGRDICMERFGWRPRSIGRVLVVPESSTIRRIVAQHSGTFASVYPLGNNELRRWLATPEGDVAAIWFLSPIARGDTKRRVARRGR